MIEVEKKFILSKEEKARLIKAAEFLKEIAFTDTYYDTADYKLTRQDRWFRSRDGKFELKLPLHEGIGRVADQYDELDDERAIREALGLVSERPFAEDLAAAGYAPFCVCTTHRKKYKKDGFAIDLDEAKIDDFSYEIAEIELLVANKADMAGAVEKIMDFARAHGLNTGPVNGKVRAYLKERRPEHHEALVKAGVLRAS